MNWNSSMILGLIFLFLFRISKILNQAVLGTFLSDIFQSFTMLLLEYILIHATFVIVSNVLKDNEVKSSTFSHHLSLCSKYRLSFLDSIFLSCSYNHPFLKNFLKILNKKSNVYFLVDMKRAICFHQFFLHCLWFSGFFVANFHGQLWRIGHSSLVWKVPA